MTFVFVSAASKQMQEVTLRLVKESFGEMYYGKALDCVKALRSEAVSVSLINYVSIALLKWVHTSIYTICDIVVNGGHLDESKPVPVLLSFSLTVCLVSCHYSD